VSGAAVIDLAAWSALTVAAGCYPAIQRLGCLTNTDIVTAINDAGNLITPWQSLALEFTKYRWNRGDRCADKQINMIVCLIAIPVIDIIEVEMDQWPRERDSRLRELANNRDGEWANLISGVDTTAPANERDRLGTLEGDIEDLVRACSNDLLQASCHTQQPGLLGGHKLCLCGDTLSQ